MIAGLRRAVPLWMTALLLMGAFALVTSDAAGPSNERYADLFADVTSQINQAANEHRLWSVELSEAAENPERGRIFEFAKDPNIRHALGGYCKIRTDNIFDGTLRAAPEVYADLYADVAVTTAQWVVAHLGQPPRCRAGRGADTSALPGHVVAIDPGLTCGGGLPVAAKVEEGKKHHREFALTMLQADPAHSRKLGEILAARLRKIFQVYTYKLTIHTRDEHNGGTNSTVLVTIKGDRGNSPQLDLDADGRDDFERGNADDFWFTSRDAGWQEIGFPVGMDVKLDGGDEWHPGRFTLEAWEGDAGHMDISQALRVYPIVEFTGNWVLDDSSVSITPNNYNPQPHFVTHKQVVPRYLYTDYLTLDNRQGTLPLQKESKYTASFTRSFTVSDTTSQSVNASMSVTGTYGVSEFQAVSVSVSSGYEKAWEKAQESSTGRTDTTEELIKMEAAPGKVQWYRIDVAEQVVLGEIDHGAGRQLGFEAIMGVTITYRPVNYPSGDPATDEVMRAAFKNHTGEDYAE